MKYNDFVQTLDEPLDTVIYIGRFQPFHNAHMETLKLACAIAKKVIVVIGSANQPRDEKNPFTQDERIDLIFKAIKAEGIDTPVRFVSVEDQMYGNTAWAISVAEACEPHINVHTKTKIIGFDKDESSFYIHMFPQWGEPIEVEPTEVLDATTVRELFFSPAWNPNLLVGVCPQATIDFLENFKKKPEYKYICEGWEFIKHYRDPYKSLPYEITFNTGDAVVFKSGHVLMVKRRAHPGKGLWALPGGFLDAKKDNTLQDCAIRELYEETGIKVPEAVVRGCIKEEKVFSARGRDRRGRFITTIQHIVLPEDKRGFPKTKAADDAEKTKWIHISQLNRANVAFDHYDIIKYFEGKTH